MVKNNKNITKDITEQKNAENMIQTLKQQMEYILGATKTGIDIIDKDFYIRYIDPEWQKVYGDPADKKCHEYFMGRSEVCPGCNIVTALKTKKPIVGEEILIKEGNRPVQVTTIPFQNKQGEWLVAEVNTDITERKKAEAELKESEEKYRLLADNIQDNIWILGLDGKFKYMSPAVTNITGYTIEEVMGHSLKETIAPKYFKTINDLLAEELAKFQRGARPKDQVETIETELTCKDGSYVPVEIKASFLFDSNQEVSGILGVTRDITERKKMEKLLHDTYIIINKSPVVAFEWKNAEGWPVEFVTDNVKKLFGYTDEEFRSGKVPYSQCIHPDDLKRVSEEVSQFSSEEGKSAFVHKPYRIVTKNGEVKIVDDKTSIVRDTKGNITHYQGILIDVTKEKQAEEELKSKYRELEKINKFAIGREVKMVELKKETNKLLKELGKEQKYNIKEDDI